MRINGKVARIVDRTMVALNIGKKQGVREGDSARVYRQVDVQDPDSHEELGTVHLTKVELRVTYVDDRFCIAETVGTAPARGLGSLYLTFGEAQQLRVTTNPKEVDSSTVLIAIGDPVYIERDEKAAAAVKRSTKDGDTRPDEPKPAV